MLRYQARVGATVSLMVSIRLATRGQVTARISLCRRNEGLSFTVPMPIRDHAPAETLGSQIALGRFGASLEGCVARASLTGSLPA
jgi:hypothetical protein